MFKPDLIHHVANHARNFITHLKKLKMRQNDSPNIEFQCHFRCKTWEIFESFSLLQTTHSSKNYYRNANTAMIKESQIQLRILITTQLCLVRCLLLRRI